MSNNTLIINAKIMLLFVKAILFRRNNGKPNKNKNLSENVSPTDVEMKKRLGRRDNTKLPYIKHTCLT